MKYKANDLPSDTHRYPPILFQCPSLRKIPFSISTPDLDDRRAHRCIFLRWNSSSSLPVYFHGPLTGFFSSELVSYILEKDICGLPSIFLCFKLTPMQLRFALIRGLSSYLLVQRASHGDFVIRAPQIQNSWPSIVGYVLFQDS
ncbi:hypothetical protein Sjap_002617 [Stephania japonica]|uniref:Uncharacterized protein n=1 Tax=Stephania japonica TaxID=461633 RepID=A0AAP0PSS6_9MAGN